MFAAKRGDGGEIGCLDERIRRHFGDNAGEAVAVFGEKRFQRSQIKHVGLITIIGGGRVGEFLQDRDGIEVEPAELQPAGAAARTLQVGYHAEGRGDRVHAAGGEKHVARRGVLIKPRDVALHVGRRVAFKTLFLLRLPGGEFADAQQVVLGLARREKHAAVLEKGLRARSERGVFGKCHAGERGLGRQQRGGFAEVEAQLFGGADRRGQPDRVPGQAERAQEVRAGLFGEGVHHKTRIARRHVFYDFRVTFFVADHVAHRGQARGHPVQTVGDALTQRKVVKHRHEAPKMARSRVRWQPQG